MSSGQSGWSWDPHRQDHYYATQDHHGKLTYHYFKAQAHSHSQSQSQSQPLQQPQQPQQLPYHGPTPIIAANSQYATNHVPYSYTAQMQRPSTYSTANAAQLSTIPGSHSSPTAYDRHGAAQQTTQTPQTAPLMSPSGQIFRHRTDSAVHEHPPIIHGTPEAGLYEKLDSSYRMRVGAEIYSFFVVGKVFSMLHIQAASASELAPLSDNITIVKYGERAFSQIRRFIVAEVRRGFVYACPITTYSGQGCLKKGCIPSEHSVVHISGTSASYFQGEYEAGLIKASICIVPANPHLTMTPASRVHYSKPYPIEMNVKVKDIGNVAQGDLDKFIAYYNQENNIAPAPGSAAIAVAPHDRSDLAGISDWKPPN